MYGITREDLIFYRKKYFRNLYYLKSNGILNLVTGEFRDFQSLSVTSANFSYRYHANVNERVNAMFDLAVDYNLVCIFMTITLDAYFRDFLKGVFDFSKINFSSIPLHLHKKIFDNEPFTIKDLVSVINYQFSLFRYSYVFRKMKKNNDKFFFIKAVEPHRKDGVPHIHALFFVDKQYVLSLQKAFYNSFSAPQKRFETSIRKPAAYIMKYLRKSFMNLKLQNEPDELQIWYMKYRIRRFTYSFTLLPFWIYKQIYFLDGVSNWYVFSFEYEVVYKDYSKNEFVLKNKYSDIEISLIDNFLIKKVDNKVIFKKDLQKSKQKFVFFKC